MNFSTLSNRAFNLHYLTSLCLSQITMNYCSLHYCKSSRWMNSLLLDVLYCIPIYIPLTEGEEDILFLVSKYLKWKVKDLMRFWWYWRHFQASSRISSKNNDDVMSYSFCDVMSDCIGNVMSNSIDNVIIDWIFDKVSDCIADVMTTRIDNVLHGCSSDVLSDWYWCIGEY